MPASSRVLLAVRQILLPTLLGSAVLSGVFTWMLVARMSAFRSFGNASLFALKLLLPCLLGFAAIALAAHLLSPLFRRFPKVRQRLGWWLCLGASLSFLASVVTVVSLQPFWLANTSHVLILALAVLAALVVSWFLASRLERLPALASLLIALAVLLLPGFAATQATRSYGPTLTADAIPAPDLGTSEVFLIGLDGATFDVIKPMIEAGDLPNIAKLMAEGSHAVLQSEMAPNQPFANSASKGMRTPVIWETIISGHHPKDHGIWDFYFTRIAGLSEPLPFRLQPAFLGRLMDAKEKPVYSTDAREQRLWEIVAEHLPDTLVVGWVDSWPAFGPSHCQLVSDRAHYDEHALAVPQELSERFGWYFQDFPQITEAAYGETFNPFFADDWEQDHPEYARNQALLEKLQKGEERDDWYLRGRLKDTAQEVFGFTLDPDYAEKFSEDDPRYWEHHLVANESKDLARDAFYARVAMELMDDRLAKGEALPTFTAAYFPSTDTAQHWLWKYYEPEAFSNVDPGSVERLGDAIPNVYRHADRIVGEFMARADENTTIVIVSDHGGGAWLEQEGPNLFGGDELHLGYSGNHRENGVFIARGPGIKAGAELEALTLYDVTPTLLYLLDLPLSSAMSGEMAQDIFEPSFLAARAPKEIADYGARVLPPEVLEAVRLGSAGDKQYMDKLNELGYAETSDDPAPPPTPEPDPNNP